MRFPELVCRNVLRRPFRTMLTVAALATAMMAIVTLLGICNGFKRAFSDVYGAHGIDVVVSRQGSADRLSSAVEAAVIDQIQALPAIDRTAGVLLETLSLEQQGIYGVPTMGLNPGSWLLDDYESAAEGNGGEVSPRFSQSGGPELLVGRNLARRLGIKPGDQLLLFDEPFEVAGVFRSRSVWENGSLILPLAHLQRLTGRDGQVTYVNVVLDRAGGPLDPAAATAAIEALDPRLLALATADFVRTDTRLKLADAMAWMTSLVAVIIGSVGALNTMLTSVHERTREIGILRAIGWPRRRIVLMILAESLCLVGAAAVLGGVAALGLTKLLSLTAAAGGMLVPAIDLPIMAQGLAIALGIGLLGAWLPARRAARLQPTAAFREIT
jgi:putative ABC transport system permease protein